MKLKISKLCQIFTGNHQIWLRLGRIYQDLAKSRRDQVELDEISPDLSEISMDLEENRPNLDETSPDLNEISVDLKEIRPDLDLTNKTTGETHPLVEKN